MRLIDSFFILLLTICLSCGVAGSYTSGTGSLTLNKEGSYQYESYSDVAGYFPAEGKWFKSNDTIFFKQKYPIVKPIAFYEYAFDSAFNGKSIIRTLRLSDSSAFPFATVLINGKTDSLENPSKGIFLSNNDIKIDSIRVRLIFTWQVNVAPKGNFNSLIIYYNDIYSEKDRGFSDVQDAYIKRGRRLFGTTNNMIFSKKKFKSAFKTSNSRK